MEFYMKYLERGDDVTLSKKGKEQLEQFAFMNTFVYMKLCASKGKEVRKCFRIWEHLFHL